MHVLLGKTITSSTFLNHRSNTILKLEGLAWPRQPGRESHTGYKRTKVLDKELTEPMLLSVPVRCKMVGEITN